MSTSVLLATAPLRTGCPERSAPRCALAEVSSPALPAATRPAVLNPARGGDAQQAAGTCPGSCWVYGVVSCGTQQSQELPRT